MYLWLTGKKSNAKLDILEFLFWMVTSTYQKLFSIFIEKHTF